MHTGRARAMLEPVVLALCWLRDEGRIVLTFKMIMEYIQLERIIDLANDGRLPEWIAWRRWWTADSKITCCPFAFH